MKSSTPRTCVICDQHLPERFPSGSASTAQTCSKPCTTALRASHYKTKHPTFWSWVAIGDADQCWEWAGGRQARGYGQTKFMGKFTGAHRVAWILTNGPIAAGLVVRHICNNPPCCNPQHLMIGTQADNMADCIRAKRKPQGESCTSAKLTEDQVRHIRTTTDESPKQLAARYGIGIMTVSSIRNRKSWKHLP